MGKALNLTFAGGMPFTQETLDQLQHATYDLGQALGRMGWDSSAEPVIISGCRPVAPGDTEYTDGWMYFNDSVHYFEGGDTVGTVGKIKLQVVTTSVVYEDSTPRPLYSESTIVLTTDLDLDAIAALDECKRIGGYSETLQLAVPTSLISLSGNVYMRRDEQSKFLHIWGEITTAAAQSIANPPQYYNLFTSVHIPEAFRPTNDVSFAMFVRYHTALYIQEVNTTEHITQLNAELRETGDFSVGFIKPAAAVSTYTVKFNAIVPLQ